MSSEEADQSSFNPEALDSARTVMYEELCNELEGVTDADPEVVVGHLIESTINEKLVELYDNPQLAITELVQSGVAEVEGNQ